MKRPNLKIKTYKNFVIREFGDRDPLSTLIKARNILNNQLEFYYYLSSGTALGLYRDKKFIKHDSDVDITIEANWLEDQYDKVIDLVHAFSKNNFQNIVTVTSANQPVQLVFIDRENDDIMVDIEFFYTGLVKDKALHFKTDGLIETKSYKRGTIEFGGKSLFFPQPIEDYLEERYGKKWEIPMTEKGRWQSYTKALKPWEFEL